MSEVEYVLITAAHNESTLIGSTIEAVLAQTIIPKKWIIVSDGSTDNTDAIIKHYVSRCDFIEYIRKEKRDELPGFVSKVVALHTGYASLQKESYEYIGILDADISFDQNYYEKIISRFKTDTLLGIAGGFIYEKVGSDFQCRPSNTTISVAGAIQFFRKECYESIGGHVPLQYGGEDWICEIMARKNGWTVQSFPNIIAYHHKQGASKRGVIKDAIRQGKMDYAVGSHPLFEFIKCVRRVKERPYFIRALLRFISFIWLTIKRDRPAVSEEVVKYMRREQLNRLKMLLHVQR